MKSRIVGLVLLLTGSVCLAAEEPSDTTQAAQADTTVTVDTTQAAPADTLSDTLSAAQRAKAKFEARYEQYQQEQLQEKRQPALSVFDTLVVYFTSERLNMRDAVDRGFYQDAGDYFRYDPTYLDMRYQNTPMRTTVQPFGLKGDRMRFISYGYEIEPFGNIPEPDGLTDMNAIPTALDDEIYFLPGPYGQLFGGGGVATMVTRPQRVDDFDYHSALLADQGGFDYAFVRGRLSKNFTDGRTVDASIAYRNADGVTFSRSSDQYKYYGDFYFPLGGNTGLRTWGHLYDMEGPLSIRPERSGSSVNRSRFDRKARVSYSAESGKRTTHFELGYQHERKGSDFTGTLESRFNHTSHGGFTQLAWLGGSRLYSLEVSGNWTEYDHGRGQLHQIDGDALLRLADISEGWRWAMTAGTRVVVHESEDPYVLPNGMLSLFRSGEGGLLMLSAGYDSRAPRLHERYEPEVFGFIYGSTGAYSEVGNIDLKKEQQLIGSVLLQLGSPTTNIGITAAGGEIIDGIDWKPDTLGSGEVRFSPINGDVTFATASVLPRLKIADFLSFLGGASYYHIDYDAFENRSYTPEYSTFSGMELHVYWPQRLIDLFAYGEITFTGLYDGYFEEDLGEQLVANAKLSFALKNYRMHFVFQNVFSTAYRQREYLTIPGRYFYFGFDWRFLN